MGAPGRIITCSLSKGLAPPELQVGRPGPQENEPLNWKVQAVEGSTGALAQPGCWERSHDRHWPRAAQRTRRRKRESWAAALQAEPPREGSIRAQSPGQRLPHRAWQVEQVEELGLPAEGTGHSCSE